MDDEDTIIIHSLNAFDQKIDFHLVWSRESVFARRLGRE
jgi:hypothetical protein